MNWDGDLGLAKIIFCLPSYSFQGKKKKKLSGTWFVKISVTIDPGQTPTKVCTFQDTPMMASVPIHLAFQDTQPKTKILIIQWYFELLTSATPL